MSENIKKVEQHGCLVCGKVYNLLVIYNDSGQLVDYTDISPGGHRVQDAQRPMAACDKHTEKEIETAFAKHYPGMEQEEDRQD